MIQMQTLLKVADNSGGRVVRCITVLGGSRHKYGQIGDVIVASVQVAEPRKQVKKKDIVKAVIVRQKKPYRRKDGSYIRFDENAVVLVNDKMEPLASRLFGPIPREIKEKNYDKIIALATDIV